MKKLSQAEFIFAAMTENHAGTILTWRYDEPYSFYNAELDDLDVNISGFMDPQNSYSSIVTDNGELLGFFCLGPDARVCGGDYPDNALDVGLGMRPDLTGKGMGGDVLDAVLQYAQRELSPVRFRTTVAAFNNRAIRLCEKRGFQPGSTFIGTTRHGQTEFMQMIMEKD